MVPSAQTSYAKIISTNLARPLKIDFQQYRDLDRPWYRMGHAIVLVYIGLGILASAAYYFTLKAENARRDQGMRDEIIDGINDKGMPDCCYNYHHHRLIYFRGVGDPETVERLTELNGRFATVEDAKRDKGDNWSGYRYVL